MSSRSRSKGKRASTSGSLLPPLASSSSKSVLGSSKGSGKHSAETPTSVVCIKEGWLHKKGKVNKAWQKRWVVLTDNCLMYYFDNQEAATNVMFAKGAVHVADCTLANAEEAQKTKFCFSLVTPTRTFLFHAESSADFQEWMAQISATRERGITSQGDATTLFTVPEKEGYALKMGEVNKAWKRRWFVLKSAHLFYFNSPQDTTTKEKASGTIALMEASVSKDAAGAHDKPHTLRISLRHRDYILSFETEAELNGWVAALSRTEYFNEEAAVSGRPQGALAPGAISSKSPLLWGSTMEGWLTKQGHRIKNWKRRWFVLKKNLLLYYAGEEDAEPKGVVDLCEGLAVDREGPDAKHTTHAIHISLGGGKKHYYLQAETAAAGDAWFSAIQEAIAQWSTPAYTSSMPSGLFIKRS